MDLSRNLFPITVQCDQHREQHDEMPFDICQTDKADPGQEVIQRIKIRWGCKSNLPKA